MKHHDDRRPTLATLTLLCAATTCVRVPEPPPTPREPVVDDYFGARVVDPYRWMERREAPRFVAWLRAQDAHARAVLAAIPGRARLLARLEAHAADGAVVRGVRQAGGRSIARPTPSPRGCPTPAASTTTASLCSRPGRRSPTSTSAAAPTCTAWATIRSATWRCSARTWPALRRSSRSTRPTSRPPPARPGAWP